MIKIYLDWNVITTLKAPEKFTEKNKETFTLLYLLLFKGKDLVIPYSNAHLKDLLNSYNKGERTKVYESLAFITELTNNVCLTQYYNQEKAKWHLREPEEFFESMIEENKEFGLPNILEPLKEYGLDKVFDLYKSIPHNIDFDKLDPKFAKYFSNSKRGNSLYSVMEDIISLSTDIKNSPDAYNGLKEIFKEIVPIDPRVHSAENTIEMLDKTMSKTNLNKAFMELYEQINNQQQTKNKEYSKITGLFMQLDFVGYASDKLDNKNKYDNLFNDALHCFYGAHCDFFLTDDKNTYRKSKAVYKSEGIGTIVMKTKEFVEYVEGLLGLDSDKDN